MLNMLSVRCLRDWHTVGLNARDAGPKAASGHDFHGMPSYEGPKVADIENTLRNIGLELCASREHYDWMNHIFWQKLQ